MINKTLKFIKIIFIALFIIIGILLGTLFFFDSKEFIITNSIIQKVISSRYDSTLIVDATNAKIGINNYKLIVSIDQVKLHKANNKDIVLSDINAVITPFELKSEITLKLWNTPLKHLIQFNENPELNVFIDNFFYHNYLVCSGDLVVHFSLFSPYKIEVNLFSNDGWYDPRSSKLKKLQLKQFNFSLSFKNDKLSINKCDLSYIDSFQAALSGEFSFSNGELLLAEFKTNLSMFPVDYLGGFWHPKFFAGIQSWVTKNVKKGIVKQAQAYFKFSGKDLEAPSLPKESIDVSIDLEDMEVSYLPGYSPITNINGNLKIDGAGLYLDNASGSMDKNKLENIKLALLFKDCVLNLKTDVTADINSFKQFIPDVVIAKLSKLGVEYALIKGQAKASVDLYIPILEQFQASNMLLDVKAAIKNVVLDKNGIIGFTDGNLAITNDADQIKFELFGKDAISMQFETTHNLSDPNISKTYFNAEITAKDNLSINDNLSLKGNFKVQFNTNQQNWQFNFNLDNAELVLLPLSYNKVKEVPFNLECSGEFVVDKVIANTCNVLGKNIRGDGKFTYNQKANIVSELLLNDVKLGLNDFSMSIVYDKDTFYYKLNAKYLDFSNFSANNFVSTSKDKANYNIELLINKVLTARKNELHDIEAIISKRNNNPIEINLKAFDQDNKLTISKVTKNNQMGYLLYTNDAGTFSKDFGIYKNIKKGELWLEMYPKKDKDNVSYSGKFKLNHFFFSNTSALTKVILGITSALNSPEALARALKGGSLQSDSFEADVVFNQGIISINNGEIQGPSYEVKIKGNMDINNGKLDFKGIYIPSVFGINKLVSDIPIVGPLISGGKNSALIGANFSISGSTKDPDIFFNPLSVLTPGFLRNLF